MTADTGDIEQLRRDARDLLVAGDARGAVHRLQAGLAFAAGDASTKLELQLDLVKAYEAAGRTDEAVNLACDVGESNQGDPRAWTALVEAADAALQRRRFQAAEWAAESLTVIAPHDSAGWSRLVAARRKLGNELALGQALRDWVRHCPDDAEGVHFLRAHQGEWADAAPPDSVRRLFDRYAPEFDEHLAHLGYRAPEEVARRLAEALAGRTVSALADLGCGTGLLGPLVRRLAHRVVGIDLSPGMLALAADDRGYDELVEGELVGFLRSHPAAFDALASADTLNYLGDLRPALSAARAALGPSGVFVFTLETAERIGSSGFRLTDTGRFEHDPDHVAGLLSTSGWRATIDTCVLRREGNLEVRGLVVTAVAI